MSTMQQVTIRKDENIYPSTPWDWQDTDTHCYCTELLLDTGCYCELTHCVVIGKIECSCGMPPS